MQYGLALANGGMEVENLVELAQLAEASDWDGIFLEDYIMWQGHTDVPTYDPWTLLGAIAVATSRVKLSIQVTPLARRRPWKVAAEGMTVDHLSGGRFILGVGLGDPGTGDRSFSALGEEMNLRTRAAILDEGLAIVDGLWQGESFTFHGKYYTVDEMVLLPRPIQRPRIPIWVGGGYPNPGPVGRALRWDGSCLYREGTHFMSPDDVTELRRRVVAARGTAEGYDISIGGNPRRDDWQEERAYISSLRQAGATWWIEYVPPDALDAMREAISRGPLRD